MEHGVGWRRRQLPVHACRATGLRLATARMRGLRAALIGFGILLLVASCIELCELMGGVATATGHQLSTTLPQAGGPAMVAALLMTLGAVASFVAAGFARAQSA